MNASAQALSIDMMSKIACIPVLFRTEFPQARADLSPWAMDEETQQQTDPDSLDFGFSFPGWHRQLGCGCILLQIHLVRGDRDSGSCLCGISASGHGIQEQFWQVSGITDWQFGGKQVPSESCQQQLREIFRQVGEIFNYPALHPHAEK